MPPPSNEWSDLATPIGFERCVRATLRELYGYVGLLAGRDRAGAERIVTDVYHSLFQLAIAGRIETVSLGALRSAARDNWVAEMRPLLAARPIELDDERADSLADLGPLERAVAVFRYVNRMPVERTAQELALDTDLTEFVEAHAVRRMRGIDQRDGKWIRAFYGEVVVPGPGLADRVVRGIERRSADSTFETALEASTTPSHPQTPARAPEPTAEHADDADDAGAIGTATGAVFDAAAVAGRDAAITPAGGERRDWWSPADAIGRSTTAEIGAEIRADAGAVVSGGPAQANRSAATADDRAADIASGVAAGVAADVAELRPDPAVARRRLWPLVVASAVVVGLVIGVVAWLAGRDGDGELEASGGADSSEQATSVAETPTSVAVAAPTSVAVASAFDPPCREQAGTAEPFPSVDESQLSTFGPLASEPTLSISLPSDPGGRASVAAALRVAAGVVVTVAPASGEPASLVALVDVAGVVRWVRCFDEIVTVGGPQVGGVATEIALQSGGTWYAVSLSDGALGSVTTAPTGSAPAATPPVRPDAAFIAPDASVSAFSAATTTGATLVLGCATDATPPGTDAPASSAPASAAPGASCTRPTLRGYAGDGSVVWERPDVLDVAIVQDGFALILYAPADQTGAWYLINAGDGTAIDGQAWSGAATFGAGPIDGGPAALSVQGGVVTVARPGRVDVWYPAVAGLAPTTVAFE